MKALIFLLMSTAALANIYAQAATLKLDCYDTPRGMICFDQNAPPIDNLEHPTPDNPSNDQ
jgi:hypothetical protein